MKAEETHQCGKCGACLTACPVYREIRDEAGSPRAKVQLIKHYAEKNLPTSPHLSELVNRCLMCGGCTAGCPSGVRHDSLFMRMRESMVADHGEDWKLKAMFHFLSHDAQLRLAARFAKFGRNAVLEHLAKEVRIGNIPMGRLPRFNSVPIRDQVPMLIEPKRKTVGTVLYFTGCGTQYVYESIGHAAVKVLTRMGYRVEIPKGQVCCGLPMFFHGNLEKAKRNILTNIKLFNRPDVEAVVTDCATCGSALRREYPHVLAELNVSADAARTLGEKVRDLSEFLFENYHHMELALKKGTEKTKVTYHAPCHLKNIQGVTTEVEALLGQLPSVEYVRAVDFDACCGGGGAFFYDHPEISHRMVRRKIKNAKATGAGLWATGCPGCRVNIVGNMSGDDKPTVVHPVEIVGSFVI
jgi:glycolate oxidase iron-sulfur subunit